MFFPSSGTWLGAAAPFLGLLMLLSAAAIEIVYSFCVAMAATKLIETLPPVRGLFPTAVGRTMTALRALVVTVIVGTAMGVAGIVLSYAVFDGLVYEPILTIAVALAVPTLAAGIALLVARRLKTAIMNAAAAAIVKKMMEGMGGGADAGPEQGGPA